jgi:glycosyltransferase involved in cell wall biosynthesis
MRHLWTSEAIENQAQTSAFLADSHAKIRILHVITRLPIGGAERLLIGILQNLDKSIFKSTVCCIQDRGELADEVESLGHPVISLNMMRKGGYDFRVVSALRRIIIENRIDIIHTHLYHANLYGRLAARKEKITTISSVHNTYKKGKWHRHLINRWLAKKTFAVTAGSEDVKKDLIELDRIPEKKVILLPNGIDLSRVETQLNHCQAKRLLGFTEDDIVIGTVGRAEKQKGHFILLEAFSKLLKRPDGKQLKLLLVGDGRLLSQLKETAKSLGISEKVNFAGNVTKLADIYRAVDIFTMPSLWEGLSLAMLEAMAAELPVVATDVGGARDVLGNDQWGLLVPPNEPDALASAIAKLLDSPALNAAIASAGKQRVHDNYSVATLTNQLSHLYRTALEQ